MWIARSTGIYKVTYSDSNAGRSSFLRSSGLYVDITVQNTADCIPVLQFSLQTRKLCYRKDDCTMHLIYECPESFWDSLTTPTDTFPKLFLCAFVLIDSMNVHENLKCVALAILEIIAIGVLVGGCEPYLRSHRWYHLKERWWLPIGPP